MPRLLRGAIYTQAYMVRTGLLLSALPARALDSLEDGSRMYVAVQALCPVRVVESPGM